MIWDIFFRGRFICHFPMYGFQVEQFLSEVKSAFEVRISEDGYSSRIELL